MTDPNWHEWQRRWDRQQNNYLPQRERTMSLMLDVVEHTAGPNPRLLDLGCGPGSLLVRAFEGFPAGEFVAVDLDPFLLEIAQNNARGRAVFLQADFCQEDWDRPLEGQPFDAVSSASVIHYLQPDQLGPLMSILARRLCWMRSTGADNAVSAGSRLKSRRSSVRRVNIGQSSADLISGS